jgi:hypothetical protein
MFEHRRISIGLSVALFGVLLLPCAAVAQTIYRHIDENGLISFSDVATEGAESLTLEVSEPRENAFDEQQALIEQQLTVAKALEESRLAREDARTRRIEAQAKSQPQTVYHREDDRQRYVGGRWGWWGGYPGYPGHPGKPVHPIEPPPQKPPTRPVPLPPLNGS